MVSDVETCKMKLSKSLERLFVETDAILKTETGIDISLSGCSCTMVLIILDRIYCANVGACQSFYAFENFPKLDTRRQMKTSLLNSNPNLSNRQVPHDQEYSAKPDLIIQPLITEHLPSNDGERARIIKNGGEVRTIQSRITHNKRINIGPLRVWKKNANSPGLHVTRSFGDLFAKEIGVICTPSLLIRCLQAQDYGLVEIFDIGLAGTLVGSFNRGDQRDSRNSASTKEKQRFRY